MHGAWHAKYVLAASSADESLEWQGAIEAHAAYASSEQGKTAYAAVLAAREATRTARFAALEATTPSKRGVAAGADPHQRRQRCDTVITGPGTPAALCARCGEGEGAHACVVCRATGCGDDLMIRAGIICDDCCAEGGGEHVCCRCDAPVGSLRVSARLCARCGGGGRTAHCCRSKPV